MKPVPIRSARAFSAVDRLVESLRDLIIEQRLPAGTRLGSERDLIEAAGVSRPTVREAVQILERDGLVRVKPGPGGGLIVSGVDHSQIVRALGYLLEYEETPPHDFLEARAEIEATCTRLATRHATKADMEAIAATIDRMRAAPSAESSLIAEVNIDFHVAIARAAHNHVLLRVTQSLIDLIFRSTVRVVYTDHLKGELVHVHQRILDAIRERDPEAGDRRMRRHMNGFEEYVDRTGQLERIRKWAYGGDDLLDRLRDGLGLHVPAEGKGESR